MINPPKHAHSDVTFSLMMLSTEDVAHPEEVLFAMTVMLTAGNLN